jgi:hypothetical protein
MRAAAARERAHLFYGLDGRASERFKAGIEALLREGGHENVPAGAGTVVTSRAGA